MIEQGGFYVIGGAAKPLMSFEGLRETRSKNYMNAVKKFYKLRRAMKYFRLFSSVYAVGAVNSIAWWNTNEQSDIDLFVITKPGSIWSTRFWMVLPFILFGVRPGASKQDPFCFSFFVSHDALALEHLRFPEGDHEFTFWLKSLVPLYDRGEEFRVLTHANPWANHALPNVSSRYVHPLHQSSSCLPAGKAPVPTLPPLEPLYRSIQRKRFPLAIRQLENKDSRVVINDQLLKFHVTDRRAEFEKTYQELIQKMIA